LVPIGLVAVLAAAEALALAVPLGEALVPPVLPAASPAFGTFRADALL